MTQAEREARIEQARRKPSAYLNAADIAPIVSMDAQCIREKARKKALPYSADTYGNRVKIYKQSFFDWYDRERGTCGIRTS